MRRALVFIETHAVLSGQDTVKSHFHSYQPEFIQNKAPGALLQRTGNHPKIVWKITAATAASTFFRSAHLPAFFIISVFPSPINSSLIARAC